MPYPESPLKRSPGRQDGDGGGGGAERTPTQAAFLNRLERIASRGGLILQDKKVADLAFAISKVTSPGGKDQQVSSHKVFRQIVVIAAPTIEVDLQQPIFVVDNGDYGYSIHFMDVLKGCDEQLEIGNVDFPGPTTLVGDIAVISKNGDRRVITRNIRIGEATDSLEEDTILVVTAIKRRDDIYLEPNIVGVGLWGIADEIFDPKTGQLRLSSIPAAEPAKIATPETLDLSLVCQEILATAKKQAGKEPVKPQDLLLLSRPVLKFGDNFPADLVENLLQENEALVITRLPDKEKPTYAKIALSTGWQDLFDEAGNVRPEKLTAAKPAAPIPTPATKIELVVPAPDKTPQGKFDWNKIQSGLKNTPEAIKARFAQQDLSPRLPLVKPREIPPEPIRMPKTGGPSSTTQESGRPKFKSSAERHAAHNQRLKAKQKARQGKGGGKKRY